MSVRRDGNTLVFMRWNSAGGQNSLLYQSVLYQLISEDKSDWIFFSFHLLVRLKEGSTDEIIQNVAQRWQIGCCVLPNIDRPPVQPEDGSSFFFAKNVWCRKKWQVGFWWVSWFLDSLMYWILYHILYSMWVCLKLQGKLPNVADSSSFSTENEGYLT